MNSNRLSGFIGNILEHYDSALFGLLAPFIAPLFFDASDPLTALILTYGILPLGMVAKPIGSVVFGRIGDLIGRREALSFSLVGMAVATFSIGLIPTYQEIGLIAPCLLAVLRMLQAFFAAGEAVGGAIFILENSKCTKRAFLSSLYDASTIFGILLASSAVTILAYYQVIEYSWRYLYFAGAFTALFGFYLRYRVKEVPLQKRQKKNSFLQDIREERGSLLKIILASGFSYSTYAIPFSLMNGFVPLVTDVSKAEVMQINTGLLVVDMALLPFFGYLALRFGKERVMAGGAFCILFGAIPLFCLLPGSSFFTVACIRLLIVISGVAFAAPYYAWAMELVPFEKRYTIMALGNALGSLCLGAPAAAISLFLFQYTGWVFAPGLYLFFGALAVTLVIIKLPMDEKIENRISYTV